jgi:multidrug resistance efflux pump
MRAADGTGRDLVVGGQLPLVVNPAPKVGDVSATSQSLEFRHVPPSQPLVTVDDTRMLAEVENTRRAVKARLNQLDELIKTHTAQRGELAGMHGNLQHHLIAGAVGDLTLGEWKDLSEDLRRLASLCDNYVLQKTNDDDAVVESEST